MCVHFGGCRAYGDCQLKIEVYCNNLVPEEVLTLQLLTDTPTFFHSLHFLHPVRLHSSIRVDCPESTDTALHLSPPPQIHPNHKGKQRPLIVFNQIESAGNDDVCCPSGPED